jgi:hypothetical protein
VLNAYCYSARILFKGNAFGCKSDIGAKAFSMATQNWFEYMLIAGRGLRRTKWACVGPGGTAPPDFGVRKVPPPRQTATLLVACSAFSNFIFDTQLPENFHAARRDARELVLERSVRMPLDKDRANAMMGEQARCSQSIQTSTNDNYGMISIHLLFQSFKAES